MASRKKRLEALETRYGKRESAIDDEPAILRSPELYNTYVYICRAIGKEPADLDAISGSTRRIGLWGDRDFGDWPRI